MDRTCSRNGGGRWWESQNERDQYQDRDIGGWLMLKCILERWGIGYGLD
jgi:hypothetical protein